jgi:hypothetical protein
MDQLGKVGRTFAKGVTAEKTELLKDRIETSTSRFKSEASDRIESLAAQIRSLGQQFEADEEAASLARNLERTADYLRYRPTAEVAADAWEVTRKYRLLWWAGGLLAGVIIYRMASRD